MATDPSAVNLQHIKSDVRRALINNKVNACPIAIRLGWHASGTFSKADGTGGSDGATMRFSPEADDDANAGLNIARDLLEPVVRAHPEISRADLWVHAAAWAVEWAGGPKVPVRLGRSDAVSGVQCPR